MLLKMLEIIITTIIVLSDFIASAASLKKIFSIFFPIVLLSIFPLIAEFTSSFASISKSSLYLFASLIKEDIPKCFGLLV